MHTMDSLQHLQRASVLLKTAAEQLPQMEKAASAPLSRRHVLGINLNELRGLVK